MNVLELALKALMQPENTTLWHQAVHAVRNALEQAPAATYSDIVSDGGMDPRNKFDHSPERQTEQALKEKNMADLKAAAQQALKWADNQGEIVFCFGGWKAVDGMNAWTQALRTALAQDEQNTAVHMTHCNQGECEGVCKYGEEYCPALAWQEQEPVVWNPAATPLEFETECSYGTRFLNVAEMPNHAVRWRVVAPPRREWQGLSEEEIADAQDAAAIQFRKSQHGVRVQQLMPSDSPDWWLARAIEQALKEKNA